MPNLINSGQIMFVSSLENLKNTSIFSQGRADWCQKVKIPFVNSRNILDSQPEIHNGLRMSLDFFPFVMQEKSPESLP